MIEIRLKAGSEAVQEASAQYKAPARIIPGTSPNRLDKACREREKRMKSIKTIGLAAFAAVMAMAFIGASPAMAENTQLCKVDESPCPAKSVVTHVHAETSAGAKAKLLSKLGTVECKVLSLGIPLGLGAPLVIHSHFTYTECTRGKENCTVVEMSIESLLKVLKLGHETADVTGEGEVSVHCGFFIWCTYNGENLWGAAKGSLLSTEANPNGEVTISEQTTQKVSGLLCPETAKLDIAIAPLEAVYITAGTGAEEGAGESIALCKADERPCALANLITHIHEETLAGAKAKLLNSKGAAVVECKVLFLGDTLKSLGVSLVVHGHFTFTECLRGAESCTVTETSTDSLINIWRFGAEAAEVTGEGEVNVHCGSVINCTYNHEGLTAAYRGPLLGASKNSEVELREQALQAVSGTCPEALKLDITTVPLEAIYISE